MKTKIILIFILFIKLLFAEGWYQQASGVSGLNLNSVWFVNGSTGYAAGGTGTILKTTNAGTNWVTLASGTTQNLFGISFANQLTGWAAGDNGTIIKTTNGGVNWVAQVSSTTNMLESVYFIDALNGYAGGRFTICKTTDGGTSWSHVTISDDMTGINFVNAQTGWGCCWGGHIYFTTNGGNNWSQQVSGVQVHLHGIYFINAQSGWTVVDDPGVGGILATTNGGTNWSMQLWNIPGQHSVYFVDQNTGYTCGGDVYKTTNGGTNWTQQIVPSGVGECLSVFFTNANTGWSVTAFGKIIATTTGGLDAIRPISSEIPDKYSLSQNYPNPFNPVTQFEFRIAEFGFVQIKVLDITGREAATLVNGQLKAGTYRADWDASNYPSGIYFYRIITSGFTETKKMILIK